MKRYVWALLLLVILFGPGVSSGQTYDQGYGSQMFVGIQAGTAIPTGDLSDNAKLGWGGQGNFEYLATPNLSLMATVGYYLWGAKNDLLGLADFTFSTIPVLIGAKYLFMQGDLRPYVGADLGIHFLKTKISSNINIFGSNLEESNTESKFGFAPMAGLRMHMPPNVDLDLNISYNIIPSSGSTFSNGAISTSSSSTTYLGIIVGALIAL
ncbi:MAG: outer membrane beta-barrel protein [Bacteroidota bacterium]|jgi:outer membrane protein W|nr:porin family protein [Ignavibacteria bacterium]HEX2963099.1 outer membrane beta-barrel protein [Ignavibacteriales bacterium]MCU7498418.1 porin family protein [Ignavibacteria bacterium]MCU7513337.1 porin family protein [Ignavibacteria bacterium]MCU7520007.1 porin family protein [Ignavibacteria bacterium]